MLAKSISTSRKLNKVGDSSALLYTWMLSHLDDFGNFDGAVDVIRGSIVPMRNWKLDKVQKIMDELLAIGAWVLYEVDGEPYIHCEKFNDFQTFKGDRERISLYPKYKQELRKPVDSKWNPMDSSKLSEVKVSESKLSELNPAPKSAGYMAKFKTPKKIYSSKHLLASEISEWAAGKLKIPMLMKFCDAKGEQFVRDCWAQAKDSNARDKIAIFMFNYGNLKVVTKEKIVL